MIRVGQGFDCHRLVNDRPLVIGGVAIESSVGSEAHSDGDVLLHALMDALLGALGEGDIGEHFPPDDEAYKNADSAVLLHQVLRIMGEREARLMNVDSTVFLEAPKLSPYKKPMVQRLALLLGLPEERVSVKAKTMEGLGLIGSQEAIAASVVVLLQQES